MSKILLIQQYLGTNNEVGPVFPIGLAYIATSIAQTDWEVKAIDMNIYDYPYEKLLDTIIKFQPNVIGISLRNIDNVDYDDFNYFYKELSHLTCFVRQYAKFLIVGGAGFSIFAADIMNQNRDIDYGILQEGEATIVELLYAIKNGISVAEVKGLYFWENETLRFTGQRNPINFSKSSMPDRSFFEVEKYNKPLCMGVQTKRGCSLKCSYCTYPFLNKHTERFRDAKNVVDEIELLVNKYHIEEIIFCDDIFNSPIEHSMQIINEIIERKIQIRWSAWFDVGSTDKDFIRLAIKSGCYRFCFSTEGVIDQSLNLLKKNFNAKQADKLISTCLSKEFKGIDFRFSLFAMPPGQTYFGMLKTIFVVFKTHIYRLNSKCLVSWIRLLPNTELYNAIGNPSLILLPKNVTESTKSSLFYNNTTLNPWIVKIYKGVLSLLTRVRKLRKKLTFKNALLWN